MSTADEITALIRATPPPKCAELLPFTILAGDVERGYVKMQFEPLPAFGNHFGHIQGGFLSAIMDVPVSSAAFLKTGQWLPLIEMKTSCISPARIGPTVAEAEVLRAGRNVVFVEGKLWVDGKLSTHVSATLLGQPSAPLVSRK